MLEKIEITFFFFTKMEFSQIVNFCPRKREKNQQQQLYTLQKRIEVWFFSIDHWMIWK